VKTFLRMYNHYILRRWVIFHIQRRQYFRLNAQGYTSDIRQAGWYSEKEALAWEEHSPFLVKRY
jgi:hypothetical protein